MIFIVKSNRERIKVDLMNKKEFYLKVSIEDKNLLGNIYEKYRMCIETSMKIGTEEFYSSDIWMEFYLLQNSFDVNIEFEGAFEYSERKRVYFVPKEEDYYEIENEKIKMLLKNMSSFKELKHKDYLGAIMSLGIKRELISDLVVKGNKCYFITNNIVAELIIMGLKKAGRNPIDTEILSEDFDIPSPSFEDMVKVVSSTRLDAVLSAILPISRGDAVDYIKGKKVFVNYKLITDKSFMLKNASILTIKKVGKYIFEGQEGKTRKDKIRIKLKKFI